MSHYLNSYLDLAYTPRGGITGLFVLGGTEGQLL